MRAERYEVLKPRVRNWDFLHRLSGEEGQRVVLGQRVIGV